MYSNNILNFQESTTILNTCTKKSGDLLKAPRIYPLHMDKKDLTINKPLGLICRKIHQTLNQTNHEPNTQLDFKKWMYFNKDGVNYTLNGKHLKLFLCSNIFSTESDVNIGIGKHGLLFAKLKSDLCWKKTWILLSCIHVSAIIYLYHLDSKKTVSEKARYIIHMRTALNKSWKQHLSKQQLYGH